jgi:predicted RNA binding protein YcfA (HicA-like mRNA interferase family)
MAAYMLYSGEMPVSGKDVIKKLRKAGWQVESQRGSHVKLTKGVLVTVVPVHWEQRSWKRLDQSH